MVRVTAIADAAGHAGDPRVLEPLRELDVELRAGSSRLFWAGTYPLALAAAVLVAAGAITRVGLPALAILAPDAEGLGSAPVGLIVASLGLLVLLAVFVLGKLRIPWIAHGWEGLDRLAFAESLRVLVAAGVALPVAVRASGAWGRGDLRAEAEAFAQALEAGRDAPPGRLLGPFETGLLASSASSGTVAETAAAWADQSRAALPRILPEAVARIHAAGVVIAATGITAVLLTWFGAYSRAFAG